MVARSSLIRLAKMKLQSEALEDFSVRRVKPPLDRRQFLRGRELCDLLGIAPENLDSELDFEVRSQSL